MMESARVRFEFDESQHFLIIVELPNGTLLALHCLTNATVQCKQKAATNQN